MSLELQRDSKTFLRRSEGRRPITLGSGDEGLENKAEGQPTEERPTAAASDCLRRGQRVDPPPCSSARVAGQIVSPSCQKHSFLRENT